MDYDPFSYRERHNASWDRIRHENSASVRSEPADATAYYQNYNPNDYQYNNFVPNFADQSLVLSSDYVPQDPIIGYMPMQAIQNSIIMDGSAQNATMISQNLENLEDLEELEAFEDEEDDDIEQEEEESDEEEEEEEVDRPDVYCMECDAKLEEPSLHDVAACSSWKPVKFQCPTCPESFNFERNLKIHKIARHFEAEDFVRGSLCHFCPNETRRTPFSRCSAYVGHVKSHMKSDSLICENPDCGQEFENERDLDRHFRREHSDEPYELVYCPKCEKVITFEESLPHRLVHLSRKNKKKAAIREKRKRATVRSRKFACPECAKSFVRPSELARHAAVHLRAKSLTSTQAIPKWKCAICSKEYAHKSGLQEHKRVAHGKAKKIGCRVCGAVFTKKTNHDRHMSQIHPLDETPSSGRPKFECADCPTVLNTLGSLTRHRKTCHNENATNFRPTKAVPPVYRQHICKTCKREFREPEMLKKHQRTHVFAEHRWRNMLENGERKCAFCEKSFVLRSSFLWHLQKHYEEQEASAAAAQPYCSECELTFFSPGEYRQHLDEQHTVVCGVCQQKFTSRQIYEDHICNRKFSGLPANRVLICRLCRPPVRLTTARQIREHRARHLPRKTHLCWTCHKSFRTSQLLSLHAEVHDRQPVQCAHCPQVFHSRVALKQHTRVSHGGDTNYQVVVHVDRNMAMSAQSFAEYGIAADHAEDQAHRAHSVTEWMESQRQRQATHQNAIDEQEPEQEQPEMAYQQVVAINYQQAPAPPTEPPTRPARTTEPSVGDRQPVRCEVCQHLYDNVDMLCEHWIGSDTDTDHSFGFVTCPVCDLRIRGAAEAANHLRNAHLFPRPRILEFIKPDDPMPQPPSTSLVLATTSNSTKHKHQCEQCLKTFTRKNDLERHLEIHSDERPYQCPHCSSTFRRKSTLKVHVATHSEQPPQLQCTVCERSFYEKKTLVIHMRIHTGEQPYKCRYCDLHFRTTAMTRTHEKKCAHGGPARPILSDPSTSDVANAFQPQFVAPQPELSRTITQISTLPDEQLLASRHSAFSSVPALAGMGSADTPIFVITRPMSEMQYVVIVQKSKPTESTVRYAVDTVSEIKLGQLRESMNLSIVLHNEMRLNVNTIKMLQILPSLRPDDTYKTRITVGAPLQHHDLFAIIAHNNNKTAGGDSFLRRCDVCELDLPTKRISDAHFYSEDHETAQLMYPTTAQRPLMGGRRNVPGGRNMRTANSEASSDLNCKLCGSRFTDMDSLLNHIRQVHDEPTVPARPVAHTAPIN
ncbi:unnamed protein product [Caenorhabditis sp. 36 PRJEB53466]|nr:unnamed protein product [Caenorhabditis sp. 36 PRJEB53466]